MKIIVENPAPTITSRWITMLAPWAGARPHEIGRAGDLRVVSGSCHGPGIFIHAKMNGSGLSTIMEPAYRYRGEVEWTGDNSRRSLMPEAPELTLAVESGIIGGSKDGTTVYQAHTFAPLTPVYQDTVMDVLHGRARFEPSSLVADLWVYRWREQEIFDWELIVNLAHPEHEHLAEQIASLELSSEGFLWADDAWARGFKNEANRVQLAGDVRIVDGQSIAAYGRVLASGYTWRNIAQAGSLLNELPWRHVGLVEDWVESWGPFRHHFGVEDPAEVKRIHDYVIRICREHWIRTNNKDHRGKPWDGVPFGLSMRPGDQGDQQAFGLAKMGETLIPREPLFLIPARYSAMHGMACRPTLFREADGDLLQPDKHLGLVLWDERPHRDRSVSPDRLGKATSPDFEAGETGGWFGIDDQHFSPLFEIGTYALTGSFALGFMLEAMALRRAYAMTYPSKHPHLNRSTNDMNTARAVGRVGLSLAWLGWALPQMKPMLDELLVRRADECVAAQWSGKDVEDGLVRPLRYEIDEQRMPQGCGWRSPFECIGLAGLVAAHRAGSEAAADILIQVVRTVLKYGLEPTKEPWWAVYWDQSNPGQPVPASAYDPLFYQWGGGRWGEWAGSGLKLAAQLLAQLNMLGHHDQVVEVLEAANVRYVLTPDPTIKPSDKEKVRIRSAEWIGSIPAKLIPVAV